MKTTILVPTLLLLLGGLVPAHACNIPVFRYALERWQPDPYELIIFHEGPLPATALEDLNDLRQKLDSQAQPSNLAVHVVDVKGDLALRWRTLQKKIQPTSLPWMVLRFPEAAELDFTLHSGPLDLTALKAWLDSPARREMARRLLSGQSVVWVLLESGDKKVDDDKAAWLEKTLAQLQADIQLPERTAAPVDQLHNDKVPLKIEFSVLRVARKDPAELHLVQQLLHIEDDLAQRTEPMVFPVFGRGMALYAIIGKGINQDNIERAGRFLTAACSCEAKRQNPGVDLLMTAYWEGEPPPPEPALSPPMPPSNRFALWRNIVLVLGGLLVALLLGSMVVFGRRKSS